MWWRKIFISCIWTRAQISPRLFLAPFLPSSPSTGVSIQLLFFCCSLCGHFHKFYWINFSCASRQQQQQQSMVQLVHNVQIQHQFFFALEKAKYSLFNANKSSTILQIDVCVICDGISLQFIIHGRIVSVTTYILYFVFFCFFTIFILKWLPVMRRRTFHHDKRWIVKRKRFTSSTFRTEIMYIHNTGSVRFHTIFR